jgi:hypothetical protein
MRGTASGGMSRELISARHLMCSLQLSTDRFRSNLALYSILRLSDSHQLVYNTVPLGQSDALFLQLGMQPR